MCMFYIFLSRDVSPNISQNPWFEDWPSQDAGESFEWCWNWFRTKAMRLDVLLWRIRDGKVKSALRHETNPLSTFTEPRIERLWRWRYLTLIENDNPRVPVILLLNFIFGVYALPLHLQQHRYTDRQTGREADRYTDKRTYRQMNRQAEREVGRQTDGQTGRQTDRHSGRQQTIKTGGQTYR